MYLYKDSLMVNKDEEVLLAFLSSYFWLPVFFFMQSVQISHRSRHSLFRVFKDKQRVVQH